MWQAGENRRYISIHALREESDRSFRKPKMAEKEFLSTLSVRRATLRALMRLLENTISIHALREESDIGDLSDNSATKGISIHALREESDRV